MNTNFGIELKHSLDTTFSPNKFENSFIRLTFLIIWKDDFVIFSIAENYDLLYT